MWSKVFGVVSEIQVGKMGPEVCSVTSKIQGQRFAVLCFKRTKMGGNGLEICWFVLLRQTGEMGP